VLKVGDTSQQVSVQSFCDTVKRMPDSTVRFPGAFAIVALAAIPLHAQQPFHWPSGKRAAVSLSFDDARTTQIDNGLSVLQKYGVRATFFVLPNRVKERLDGWKRAVAQGHEIGNHSATHPCTANYEFSARNGLEDFTLARMAGELDRANDDLERLLGVKPITFAYPCGQKTIGRGRQAQSYVPLVAERFLIGRGYLDESPNDPSRCDFAQTMGTVLDGLTYKQATDIVSDAAKSGRWVIFVSHEVGPPAFQTTDIAVLEQLIQYLRDPKNGLWVDTVKTIGAYVKAHRSLAR